MKFLFWRKEKPLGCEWEECCDCSPDTDKERQCGKCEFYWWVDSGYGHCRVFPKFIVVAWCRDACSLFRVKEVERR